MKNKEQIKSDLKNIMEEMFHDAHRKRCGYFDYETFDELYQDYEVQIEELFKEDL